MVSRLSAKIEAQGGNIEHLIFCDNKRRSIGEKRQALVDMANGKYIAFVDDDDDVSNDYVAQIIDALERNPDVVTFRQKAIYNGLESIVHFRHGHDDGPFTPNGITRRGAWHVNVWKRDLVADCKFLSCNYGEDKAWVVQARQKVSKEIHIVEVLHTYNHDAAFTEAPEPV